MLDGRVILDEAPDTYYQRHLDEASNSGLRLIDEKSPAHFKYWVDNPDIDKATPALTFGRMLHCAVLEPDEFGRRYSVLPDNMPRRPTQAQWDAKKSSPESNAAKARWSEFLSNNFGRDIVSAADWDKAQRMGDSARANPICAAMLQGGKREVTLRWVDRETGIKCKARIDLWQEALKFFMDVKSTVDASPEGFARSVARYRYHQQHAHYADGAYCCGLEIEHFIILAIESEPPYVCAPYHIDAPAEARGFELRQRGLKKMRTALDTGVWKGYSDDKITRLMLPAYAFFDTEEQK